MTDHTGSRPATDPAEADPADDDPMTSETIIARLTHWFRQRPTSIEFWEIVVTDERLLWCFVGESFRSLLLRADMGERDRATVADLQPDAIATYDERNFAVPIERSKNSDSSPERGYAERGSSSAGETEKTTPSTKSGRCPNREPRTRNANS